jgi:uncharacterized membrane protein
MEASGANTANPQHSRVAALVIAALLIGYAALSHHAYSDVHAKGLGAALSVGPVILIGAFLAWRWIHPLAALAVAALSGLMLYRHWAAVEENYQWSDLVQQCGLYGLIALGFVRSLLAGQTPLCTLLAEKLHGVLEPIEISYTRRATLAWTLFYGLMALAILVLFFLVSPSVWSFFVDFVTYGLIIAMAVADHAIRRRLLPRHPAGGILAAVRRAIVG